MMANSSGSAPEHADQTEITSGQKNIHAIQQVSPPTPSHEDDSVPSNPSQKARDLTDLTLNFLSNASNETLCACAVGLCATTYFILGRVGLVLIGAVGGVVLHATWDGSMNDGLDGSRAQSDRRKQKEIGAEIIRRTLDWRETQSSRTDTKNNSQAKESTKPQELEYSGFRPATRSALSSLTDAVIRDYVKYDSNMNYGSLLMICPGGGIVQLYPTNLHSLSRPAKPYYHSYFPFRIILLRSDRRTLS